MARQTTITDDQILAAARALFLEKGVSATAAEVAAKAGCAEGSIFKRFGTKADLFRAAMLPNDVEEVPWLKTLVAGLGKGDLEQHLVEVGLLAIDFFRGFMP